MGKKYIIELLDECNSKFKGIMALGLTQEQQISVELIPEESLTPYTEPDMEQVRKEAYQQGLSDAWEAARKIVTTKGIPVGDMAMVFDDEVNYDYIFSHYSASEAIEKIRAYEQEKEEGSRLRRSIKNVMSACDCSLDDIAEALQKMKKS